MRCFPKALFALLTILVIACGQLFGIGAGYICECHESPLITFSEHCHDDPAGPHHEDGGACNDPHANHSSNSSESGLPHQPNKCDLKTSLLSKLPSVPHPQMVLLVLGHEIFAPLLQPSPTDTSQPQDLQWLQEAGFTANPLHLITASIVLLI